MVEKLVHDFKAYATAISHVWSMREQGYTNDRESRDCGFLMELKHLEQEYNSH